MWGAVIDKRTLMRRFPLLDLNSPPSFPRLNSPGRTNDCDSCPDTPTKATYAAVLALNLVLKAGGHLLGILFGVQPSPHRAISHVGGLRWAHFPDLWIWRASGKLTEARGGSGWSGRRALCAMQDAKHYSEFDWGLREKQVEDCDVLLLSLSSPLQVAHGRCIEAAIFRASS